MKSGIVCFSFVAALQLLACVGWSVPPKLYVLSAGEEIAPAAAACGLLAVAPVRVPQYLDQSGIILRMKGPSLEVSEHDVWAEPLPDAIGRALVLNLQKVLGSRCSIVSWRRAPPGALRLEVEVLQFESDEQGRVQLHAQWRLAGGQAGNGAIRVFRKTGPPGPPQAGRIVESMNDLLAALSGEIGNVLGSGFNDAGATVDGGSGL